MQMNVLDLALAKMNFDFFHCQTLKACAVKRRLGHPVGGHSPSEVRNDPMHFMAPKRDSCRQMVRALILTQHLFADFTDGKLV